ncbi:jg16306 [Pararge aegeria aegeria]|uniref:Jg16306 protein n=1 Tax=Pararge aegeria aegeria TaxID=348720 RepID=A0A8S4RW76_9NEOP|nr:jg16306 [Pararge aegeria aegeria]
MKNNDVKVQLKPYRIFSIYRPSRTTLVLQDVHNLLNSQIPTILAGDWNAKHTAWHSSRECYTGRRLFHGNKNLPTLPKICRVDWQLFERVRRNDLHQTHLHARRSRVNSQRSDVHSLQCPQEGHNVHSRSRPEAAVVEKEMAANPLPYP